MISGMKYIVWDHEKNIFSENMYNANYKYTLKMIQMLPKINDFFLMLQSKVSSIWIQTSQNDLQN